MKRRWPWAWGLQIIEMLAVGLAAAATDGLSPVLHGILLWGLAPLAGLFSACQAVRRGLLNYAAWIAPAACVFAANYLLWGFSPPAGAGLLTAFAALTGAAAGEVIVQRGKVKKKGKGHTRS